MNFNKFFPIIITSFVFSWGIFGGLLIFVFANDLRFFSSREVTKNNLENIIAKDNVQSSNVNNEVTINVLKGNKNQEDAIFVSQLLIQNGVNINRFDNAKSFDFEKIVIEKGSGVNDQLVEKIIDILSQEYDFDINIYDLDEPENKNILNIIVGTL